MDSLTLDAVNRKKNAAVLAAGYSRAKRRFEIAVWILSVCLFVVLYSSLLFAFFLSFFLQTMATFLSLEAVMAFFVLRHAKITDWWLLLIAFVIGQIITDFVSGVVHWRWGLFSLAFFPFPNFCLFQAVTLGVNLIHQLWAQRLFAHSVSIMLIPQQCAITISLRPIRILRFPQWCSTFICCCGMAFARNRVSISFSTPSPSLEECLLHSQTSFTSGHISTMLQLGLSHSKQHGWCCQSVTMLSTTSPRSTSTTASQPGISIGFW